MPSAFAHAAVGSSLALLLPSRLRSAGAALLLALLAVAPDLDVLAFRVGIPYEHFLGHRGLSHSLVFAAVAGSLSYLVLRSRQSVYPGRVAALVFVAVASHGLLDAFTDAGLGVGLLIPFDHTRYFAPWRPILTSPLSIGAFFSATGAAVLANEVVWVGLPTALLASSVYLARRARSRG